MSRTDRKLIVWFLCIFRPKAVPAYERFEYLAREGPPKLVLPGKFQRLLSMFQSTDTVVSMLFNRQETITFTKLQTAVQSMTRKWVMSLRLKLLGKALFDFVSALCHVSSGMKMFDLHVLHALLMYFLFSFVAGLYIRFFLRCKLIAFIGWIPLLHSSLASAATLGWSV